MKKELTTEDLKLIAETMGKFGGQYGEVIFTKYRRRVWQPDKSAQCLEVLEWLKPLTIFYKEGNWEIGKGTDNAIWVADPDFKLAVCLAAVEWIKQSKR